MRVTLSAHLSTGLINRQYYEGNKHRGAPEDTSSS